MEKKYSAPAVGKMLAVIELLSKYPEGFSINELARMTDASVNSIYRICIEMESRDYLSKDTRTGHYYLGSAFYFIGKAAERRIDLRNNALDTMKRLKDETSETVHLTILHDKRMILFEQVETEDNIRIHVNAGASLYPHASAFGKCLLAYTDDAYLREYSRDSLVRLTSNTITDYDELLKELERIRSDGTAYDREEYMDGVMCIGSPVFGIDGKCAAAIGIIMPKYRTDEDKLSLYTKYVKDCAAKVSYKMGERKI